MISLHHQINDNYIKVINYLNNSTYLSSNKIIAVSSLFIIYFFIFLPDNVSESMLEEIELNNKEFKRELIKKVGNENNIENFNLEGFMEERREIFKNKLSIFKKLLRCGIDPFLYILSLFCFNHFYCRKVSFSKKPLYSKFFLLMLNITIILSLIYSFNKNRILLTYLFDKDLIKNDSFFYPSDFHNHYSDRNMLVLESFYSLINYTILDIEIMYLSTNSTHKRDYSNYENYFNHNKKKKNSFIKIKDKIKYYIGYEKKEEIINTAEDGFFKGWKNEKYNKDINKYKYDEYIKIKKERFENIDYKSLGLNEEEIKILEKEFNNEYSPDRIISEEEIIKLEEIRRKIANGIIDKIKEVKDSINEKTILPYNQNCLDVRKGLDLVTERIKKDLPELFGQERGIETTDTKNFFEKRISYQKEARETLPIIAAEKIIYRTLRSIYRIAKPTSQATYEDIIRIILLDEESDLFLKSVKSSAAYKIALDQHNLNKIVFNSFNSFIPWKFLLLCIFTNPSKKLIFIKEPSSEYLYYICPLISNFHQLQTQYRIGSEIIEKSSNK